MPDGRNLNHEIVKAGFAWWFRGYAPNDEMLKRLEEEARLPSADFGRIRIPFHHGSIARSPGIKGPATGLIQRGVLIQRTNDPALSGEITMSAENTSFSGA